MSQNQGNNTDVLQHSSGIRNQPGGSMQGGVGPYQRTPANYAGGPGSHANTTITLHAQNGQTRQTTTDANGAISDTDRQWLADNGGAMPISQVPPQDKAIVGTGTGAAAQMSGDTSQIGTKPLDNRPPGSFNPNTGSVSGGGNQGTNTNEDVLQHSSGIRNQPGGSMQGGVGPYQRTPANYAGGPGPHANTTITLHAQNGQTRQATTDANGAISDADRQWLADNGGAMPISQVPPQDKAIVGTGTGAAARMNADTSEIGTKPLDNRPPGSFNPNTGSVSGGGNQGTNTNEDVLQHSSGIRNQPGGSMQGGVGPYQRTPANYAGGPGPNPNTSITLHAQNGQTRQTTTDANGAISDADRQWLADNGGAMPISQVPPQDKAIVGTGTGAAARMSGDTSEIGTKPLDNRPPGSFNPNTGTVNGR